MFFKFLEVFFKFHNRFNIKWGSIKLAIIKKITNCIIAYLISILLEQTTAFLLKSLHDQSPIQKLSLI